MKDQNRWFLPSYGRPDKLHGLLGCPGGLPLDKILVVINDDDPCQDDYLKQNEFRFFVCPAGSRMGDIWRALLAGLGGISATWGLFADDMWPITPQWWISLEEAAGDTCIAYTNGLNTAFPLMRGGAMCMGGRLTADCGTYLVPPQFKHNYIDVVINDLGDECGIMRPLPHIMVDHRHWMYGGVARDATYLRGSADQHEDGARYHIWSRSEERAQAVSAIRAMLTKVSAEQTQ